MKVALALRSVRWLRLAGLLPFVIYVSVLGGASVHVALRPLWLSGAVETRWSLGRKRGRVILSRAEIVQ